MAYQPGFNESKKHATQRDLDLERRRFGTSVGQTGKLKRGVGGCQRPGAPLKPSSDGGSRAPDFEFGKGFGTERAPHALVWAFGRPGTVSGHLGRATKTHHVLVVLATPLTPRRLKDQLPGGLAHGAVLAGSKPPPTGPTDFPTIPFSLPICAAKADSSGGVESVRMTGTE